MVEIAETEGAFGNFSSTTKQSFTKDRFAVILEIFGNFQPYAHPNINGIIIMSQVYSFLLVIYSKVKI